MALRSGHGNGRGVPRIEVLPVDELSVGVADLSAIPAADRYARGLFLPGPGTSASAIAGNRTKKGQSRLSCRLGLGGMPPDERVQPYLRSARAFRRVKVAELARTIGGGYCGPGPASFVASAALALAWSRFCYEVLGDPLNGSRLADASRQNLLAAHELCAKEAQSRPQTTPSWMTRLGVTPPANPSLPPKKGS